MHRLHNASHHPAPRFGDWRQGIAIKQELFGELFRAAEAHSPREACGLVFASRAVLERGMGELTVQSWRPIPNLSQSRERFRMDPLAYAQAVRVARSAGQLEVGVYHSHPMAEAVPSARDALAARNLWGFDPSWLYLIIGLRCRPRFSSSNPVRAWRLVHGYWRECELCPYP